MAKEIIKEYLNVCEGINNAVSDDLMREGELKHSTNASSAKVGLLEKVPGQELYWNFAIAKEIQGIRQFSTYVVGLIKDTTTSDLYVKGAAVTDKTLVLEDLLLNSPLEVALNHVFYIKSDNTIGSYDGSALSTKHLTNAPTGIDDLKFAGGLMYARADNKIYVSSPPRRLVATVVGDHVAASTTINVSSTRYIRTGNVLECWTIGASAMKQNLTVLTVPSATTFTCAALAMTSAITFAGTGLDDETVTGSGYTGTTRRFYEVEILTTAASPDTFRWRVDGGSWSAGTPVAVADTTLELGVKIKWAAADGHTIGDKWSWYQTPGTLTNGDEIYYTGMKTTDIFMWNDDANVGSWFWANSDDGYPTALAEQLGTLVEVHPQSIWRFDQSRRDNIALTGTSLNKTLDVINGVVYFANNDNIYAINRNNVAPIGDKVYDYIKNASDVTKFVGTKDGRYYRLFIGTTTQENLTGAEIVFDTENDKYDIRSDLDITAYSNMVVSSKRNCYCGTSGGKVYKMGTGTAYDTTDIAFLAKSRRDSLDTPDLIKLFEKVVVYTTPGSILNVSVSIDGGEYFPIGQTTKSVQSFEINMRGIDISILIGETSDDQAPGVKGWKIYASSDEEV
jgi:hypothetical protein